MKTISKQKLDTLMDLYRELNDNPYEERDLNRILKEAMNVAEAIEKDSGINWLTINDFIWSVVRGLKRDATNEDIYKVLGLLGWGIQYEA